MASGDDIVRSDSKMDDVQIETADIVSKFKFFETYKAPEKAKKSFRITPPRDYQGTTKVIKRHIISHINYVINILMKFFLIFTSHLAPITRGRSLQRSTHCAQ